MEQKIFDAEGVEFVECGQCRAQNLLSQITECLNVETNWIPKIHYRLRYMKFSRAIPIFEGYTNIFVKYKCVFPSV